MTTPIIEILKLKDIALDMGTQTRAEPSEATIAEYCEAMKADAVFPPLVIYRTPAGINILSSGFHRHAAACLAGRDEFPCEIRQGGRIDALEDSLKANRAHGMRMTTADKTKAITMALESFPDRGDRWIAELVGVSHPTVGVHRNQLVKFTSSTDGESSTVEQPAKHVGKDGKLRKKPAKKVVPETTVTVESVALSVSVDESLKVAPEPMTTDDAREMAGKVKAMVEAIPDCDGNKPLALRWIAQVVDREIYDPQGVEMAELMKAWNAANLSNRKALFEHALGFVAIHSDWGTFRTLWEAADSNRLHDYIAIIDKDPKRVRQARKSSPYRKCR